MDTSVFEQIASSLTVTSICSPLGPDVPASITIADLDEYLDPGSDPNLDPWNNPSRVIDNDGDVVGTKKMKPPSMRSWSARHPMNT
jgi:hypothetical protein